MPTKNISGWVQQPILATDLNYLRFDRVSTGGFTITANYEVRDELSAVRMTKQITQTVGAWPASLAAILSAINTVEGT